MVKGTSKRIVVVKSPDPKVFEQAIFIVREDFRGHGGASSTDVLKEAQKVADSYIKNSVTGTHRSLAKIPPAVFAALGATVMGIVWLVIRLVGA